MENPFWNDVQASLSLEESQTGVINCNGALPSYFDVSGLASASVLAVGQALASLLECHGFPTPKEVVVDQRLTSHWFASSLALTQTTPPPIWDNVAGDYQTSDGWVRLHTNAPHHKKAALSVLGVEADKAKVAHAVSKISGSELETKIVAANGCAAAMRTIEEWAIHPQGKSVASEPLIAWQKNAQENGASFVVRTASRPLEGLKVLDLTRVIAGPVATRTLASMGANVLRIDPEYWDEPGLYEDLTIGKRCAHLDLKSASGKEKFLQLVIDADVIVHGLRKDALDKLGLDQSALESLNPNLIDVALNAYGWTGPWAARRGFDSLVQMSSGIADYGMKRSGNQRPTPLPVQALDHATGFLLAATVLSALRQAKTSGHAFAAKLSLARVAHLLTSSAQHALQGDIEEVRDEDYSDVKEETHLGAAKRLKQPLHVSGVNLTWTGSAPALRSSNADW